MKLQQGNAASQKKADPRVGEYADMMVKEHTKHLEETQQLSSTINVQPMETAMIEKMKAEGKTNLSRLSQLQGAEFDKAYIRPNGKRSYESAKYIGYALHEACKKSAIKESFGSNAHSGCGSS